MGKSGKGEGKMGMVGVHVISRVAHRLLVLHCCYIRTAYPANVQINSVLAK